MKKILLIIILFPVVTFAHSGGTDSSGGHNCNVGSCAGTYHYHNGGYTAPPKYNPPVVREAPAPTPKATPIATVTRVYHNQVVSKLEGAAAQNESKIASLNKEISDLNKAIEDEKDLKTEASLERDSAKIEIDSLKEQLDGGLEREIEGLTGEVKSLNIEKNTLTTSLRNESQARESAEESERMGLIGGVGMAGIAGWGIASYRSRKRRHGSVFGEAKIKGNISRDGRKIYHEPGGQYYNSVVVNPKEGEKYFKTKDDAEKAGFVSVG